MAAFDLTALTLGEVVEFPDGSTRIVTGFDGNGKPILGAVSSLGSAVRLVELEHGVPYIPGAGTQFVEVFGKGVGASGEFGAKTYHVNDIGASAAVAIPDTPGDPSSFTPAGAGAAFSLVGGGGAELLACGDFAADAYVDILLEPWFGKFRAFKLVLNSVRPSVDTESLYCRFSNDGGASFLATAVYGWGRHYIATNASHGIENQFSQTSIKLAHYLGTVATEEIYHAEFTIPHPEKSDTARFIFGDHMMRDAGTNIVHHIVYGYEVTQTTLDAIRLLPGSGNIASGKYALYGLR